LAAAPDGLLLEFGTGAGGSARRFAERTPRPLWTFDWFLGLPETWDQWDQAGAFTQFGEIPKVPDHVHVVAGMLQLTLPLFLRRHVEPVAFVHFDLDLYSSTSFALMTIHQRFAHGAILLFDEMLGRPRNLEHEGKAFCEFLRATNYAAEYLGQMHGESAIFRLLTAPA